MRVRERQGEGGPQVLGGEGTRAILSGTRDYSPAERPCLAPAPSLGTASFALPVTAGRSGVKDT